MSFSSNQRSEVKRHCLFIMAGVLLYMCMSKLKSPQLLDFLLSPRLPIPPVRTFNICSAILCWNMANLNLTHLYIISFLIQPGFSAHKVSRWGEHTLYLSNSWHYGPLKLFKVLPKTKVFGDLYTVLHQAEPSPDPRARSSALSGTCTIRLI